MNRAGDHREGSAVLWVILLQSAESILLTYALISILVITLFPFLSIYIVSILMNVWSIDWHQTPKKSPMKKPSSVVPRLPWSLASVVFFSQSQSGSTQWSPSSGCHLAGCAPVKELILGVNSAAAAAQWGRVGRAEPGSQTRPRPGGFETPHPSPQTGGLG